jgi:hypothetical protein
VPGHIFSLLLPIYITTTIITLESYKQHLAMGHAPLCAQDGNDRSEEDGNKMIALLDIIVPTTIRWWSQFYFLKVKKSLGTEKRDIDIPPQSHIIDIIR